MKWVLSSKTKNFKSENDIISLILSNRGIKKGKETKEFLNPTSPSEFSTESLGIKESDKKKAFKRIETAISNNEAIVVYGDYDADGICSTAIWWETLNNLNANVLPFIPLREKEGYGLSIDGIGAIISDEKYHNPTLIICVDSGIVANEAVDFANSKGIDVIVVDHHEKPEIIPKAFSILHSTSVCAAGLSYFLTRELSEKETYSRLELAAIATVTDLMPLVGINRSLVKFGLELLNKTSRPGLRALYDQAGIKTVSTYEIGYMIGPRINASGRIENALTALRLLCTSDFSKANEYASLLNDTNKDRQVMTQEMTMHALQNVVVQSDGDAKILVIEDDSYHQGIIGLIAGKLVEKHYLPTIVISRGEEVSKASARSISGFNIIEAIRTFSDLLINAGGHPMAAGFSIETKNIDEFKKRISEFAKDAITEELLEKQLSIDCELPTRFITKQLIADIEKCAPFGLANPEPIFSGNFQIRSIRTVGSEAKHLKLELTSKGGVYNAIGFGKGELARVLAIGQDVSVAYVLEENFFNGTSSVQLRIRDIKPLSVDTN